VTSSGAAAAHPDPRAQALMSIGEVLAELRADFPDATISKLRFLEAEGLVEPRRTPAGYRKYSWDDVSRLRHVLTAQRDHYLPLRVIREQLAASEPAGPPRARPALVAVESADSAAEPADARLSRAELLERAGLAEQTLADLERHGLIRARAGGWYDADALAVAGIVTELARYGLEPRHLRGYRAAADREIGLYAQLVTPLARQNDPAARARAAETVRELVALAQRLHGTLIKVGLRDTLGQ
jgi:DNA-binding transcriptional MerR regulator